MRAAMKKVLSPHSETRIALNEATKPEVKPRPPFVGVIVEFVAIIVIVDDHVDDDDENDDRSGFSKSSVE